MAMRTHETSTNSNTNNPTINHVDTRIDSSSTVSSTKTNKPDQRNDGTVSDSALSTQTESSRKKDASMSSKALVILGLSKKGNSSSNPGLGKSMIIFILINFVFSLHS